MAASFKVALIQLHSIPYELEQNFERASSFVKDAATQGADLAVLPEYALSGWSPKSPAFRQCAIDGREYLAKWQALAAQCKICFVPGTILELHIDDISGKEVVQNATYFISSTGEVLGRYHKKNVWIPEREFISSSANQPHEVIDTPLGKVGLLICWDLAFPEAFRELVRQGAQTIIVPAFWADLDSAPYGPELNPKTEHLFLDAFVTTRAFENTCAMVFVNGGDPTDGRQGRKIMTGMSRVSLPFIGALGDQTKNNSDEAMSIVEIDTAVLTKAEEVYRIRADICGEDWHYSYRNQAKTKL